MKPTALFVNVARAELVAPGALLDALKKGRPGYAAIDVYEEEPVTGGNHPYLKMDERAVHAASRLGRMGQLRALFPRVLRADRRVREGRAAAARQSDGEAAGEGVARRRSELAASLWPCPDGGAAASGCRSEPGDAVRKPELLLRQRLDQRRDVIRLVDVPQPLGQFLRLRLAEAPAPTRPRNFAISPSSSSGTMREPQASSAWRTNLPLPRRHRDARRAELRIKLVDLGRRRHRELARRTRRTPDPSASSRRSART